MPHTHTQPHNHTTTTQPHNHTQPRNHTTTQQSGSFFYYTSDGKYMVKTVSETEHLLLKNFLELYYRHMVNEDSTGRHVVVWDWWWAWWRWHWRWC